MDQAQHLSTQLEGMERLVDGENGAILFRHPSLRGIPDLVLEGDGYTLEFIGATLLCVDIRNAAGLAKLLAEPFKTQLPVAV
ncbi:MULTISPECIES: hypothetical protein [Cyanobium]|mgnify:FL=1|jgi:hypothetical protein|uniref:Uncharacterized protein n=1 Tax=Cyanobium usitatum str. Tous TaxID=2116684 RepID=A0A2P7MZH7_9CYAN|nr:MULTISPECIES: hypothetical protein [Cyanobium]MCP9779337.1 hypothetical protein [Cyanobium sp. To12R1]PSJ06626.1 hypothetical protein C7K55_04050 [Cyanobium usitatum str. Tous]